jgi:hypothetical protein
MGLGLAKVQATWPLLGIKGFITKTKMDSDEGPGKLSISLKNQ